jgi:uncharacterized membrane protein
MEVNWKQKLSSRKFWVALIGFVTSILIALGVDKLTIEQIITIITAVSALIAYIIGEGMVDAARANTANQVHDGQQFIGFTFEKDGEEND